MKTVISLIFSMIMTMSVSAQVQTDWRTGGENIFSWGNAGDPGIKADNVVRFSAFFNQQLQYHVDFGDHVGMYTGQVIRNIGFIHKFGDTLKIKQRVYSLGAPLAIKIGNMTKGPYLAFGPEIELFFHFKEKAFLNGQKYKDSEWFSSRTDLLHPSVFAEVGIGHGIYLRYRYYLTDFFRKKDVVFPGDIQIPYNNSPSQLMYISVGTMISKKKVKQSLPEIRNASNTMASGNAGAGLTAL